MPTLYNVEIYDIYDGSNIVEILKSHRLKGLGHVARIREDSTVFIVVMSTPKVKRLEGKLELRHLKLGQFGTWDLRGVEVMGS